MNTLLARIYRWLNFFVEKPSRGLALLMGLQVLGFGVMVTFFHATPHHDIILNSLLGLHGGDDKRHPPLVYAFNHWLNMGEGVLLLPHYVVAQLFVIATYGAVYGMGVVLLKNKLQALAATLLLVGLPVYQEYTRVGVNHDVMMFPFWALIPLLTFYATRPLSQDAQQSRWWLLLGFVMGIPIWMKYHIFILLVTVGLWVLMDKEARAHLVTPYPYWALLIFLCVAAIPLEQAWQYRYDIMGYGKFPHDTENFWWRVITMPKLMLLALLLAGVISLKTRLTYPFHTMTKRETHFLCFFALMPFLVFFVVGVVVDTDLKFYWTSAMYSLWSLLLVALVRSGWRKYSAHVILVLAVALLLKPFYQYPFKKAFYPRFNNPSVVAEKIIENWRQQTSNQPIAHVLGSPGGLGGLVAMSAGNEVRFLKHHEAADDELLQKDGLFFVFSEDDWQKNRIRQDMKKWQLPEQSMKIDEYPHVIYYAILPPAEK